MDDFAIAQTAFPTLKISSSFKARSWYNSGSTCSASLRGGGGPNGQQTDMRRLQLGNLVSTLLDGSIRSKRRLDSRCSTQIAHQLFRRCRCSRTFSRSWPGSLKSAYYYYRHSQTRSSIRLVTLHCSPCPFRFRRLRGSGGNMISEAQRDARPSAHNSVPGVPYHCLHDRLREPAGLDSGMAD